MGFNPVPGAKSPGRLSLAAAANLVVFAALFGMLHRLRPPKPKHPQIREGSQVLVFSTGGIGDSLLDSAGIRALAESFPHARIHLVAHHRRPVIACHNPFVHRLHFFRKGPLAFLGLWAKLRVEGPWEAVLYFTAHDPEARCLGYLLAPDTTVGLAWRSQFGGLCAHDLDGCELRRAHLAAQAVEVAKAAGARARSEPRMVYQVEQAERVEFLEQWKKAGFSEEARPIVFQLGGGGSPYRDWPVSRFAQLLDMLHQQGLGPLVLLGGPDHVAKAQEIRARASTVPHVDFTGRLPLPLAAALLEHARALVTTDTGIMHLGFALQTPTVALLHPSPGAARVGPLFGAERHELVCLEKPSGYRKPEDARMEAITAEMAAEALGRLLVKSVR